MYKKNCFLTLYVQWIFYVDTKKKSKQLKFFQTSNFDLLQFYSSLSYDDDISRGRREGGRLTRSKKSKTPFF